MDRRMRALRGRVWYGLLVELWRLRLRRRLRSGWVRGGRVWAVLFWEGGEVIVLMVLVVVFERNLGGYAVEMTDVKALL
jgi:hypothetical protein